MSRTLLSYAALRNVPKSVWALGLVSLLMDFSSEMIHALLPIYLVTTLQASMAAVGVIEGIAEATASILKIFSGAVSDWAGRRKPLLLLGYGLAALSKPMFPLAPDVAWITSARLIDRIGKGIRGAPRDALVADVTPEHLRGAAYGLRQALDTVGAFLGPAAAICVMWVTLNDMRQVFWLASVPALFAVSVIIFGVVEPDKEQRPPLPLRLPLHIDELRRLGTNFWRLAAIAAVFSLSRFSEAFLVIKAQTVGMPIMLTPIVLVLMNLFYAGSAYPVGVLADRGGRYKLLMFSAVALIAADAVFSVAQDLPLVLVGIIFWGLHMGFSQGVFAASIADAAPASLRGTAFGVYNLISGLALLGSSFTAGLLWDGVGSWAAFAFSGLCGVLTLLGLFMLWPKQLARG